MNAVSKTAFFCCGIRAEDARSLSSICADIYAESFMTEEGQAIFDRFSDSPKQNVSNVVRARLFQDEIARHLKQNPQLQIVNIGAGFDTRPYRLAGGHWIEIDEPAIIQHKDASLPANRCANPLRRIAVNFGNGELEATLQNIASPAQTLIVIEGVFMYLEREQVENLLRQLRQYFPQHVLLCDLMSLEFFRRHMGRAYQRILELGSEFKFLEETPEDIFIQSGYRSVQEPISVVGRARDFNAIRIPGFLFRTAFKSLRDGYRIFGFSTGG